MSSFILFSICETYCTLSYIRLLDLLVEISEARAMPLKRRRLSKLLEKRRLFMGLPQDPWKFYRRCS